MEQPGLCRQPCADVRVSLIQLCLKELSLLGFAWCFRPSWGQSSFSGRFRHCSGAAEQAEPATLHLGLPPPMDWEAFSLLPQRNLGGSNALGSIWGMGTRAGLSWGIAVQVDGEDLQTGPALNYTPFPPLIAIPPDLSGLPGNKYTGAFLVTPLPPASCISSLRAAPSPAQEKARLSPSWERKGRALALCTEVASFMWEQCNDTSVWDRRSAGSPSAPSWQHQI